MEVCSLIKYITQRVFYSILTLFLIVSLTFFLLQLMPGSPFNDEKLAPAQIEILNEAYGLNDSIPQQYVRYMNKAIHGDFGVSFKYNNRPVSEMIYSKLLLTSQIGFQALLFGTIVGIFLGIIAGLNRDRFLDHFTVVIAILGVSIPSFVMAALLQYWLGVEARILPVVYNKTFLSTLMPSFSLALFVIASATRFMRTELVEILNSDFILLAKAKGLTRKAVIYKHALRNAMIPVITIVGPMTVSLLTGSTVVEKIFGVPGLGNMLVTAINTNDIFVIMGCATFYSAIFIIVIFIIDILYGIIDPRIRLTGGAK